MHFSRWTGDWYWFHLKWTGEYAVHDLNFNFTKFFSIFSGGAKSKMIANSVQLHQHKVRLARTISREPEVKESSVDDDDDDGQVSAV